MLAAELDQHLPQPPKQNPRPGAGVSEGGILPDRPDEEGELDGRGTLYRGVVGGRQNPHQRPGQHQGQSPERRHGDLPQRGGLLLGGGRPGAQRNDRQGGRHGSGEV